jgi:hypothetical protein
MPARAYFFTTPGPQNKSRIYIATLSRFTTINMRRDRKSKAEMSLSDETATITGKETGRQADTGAVAGAVFEFLPKELAVKCRKLIESYHALNGFGCLPDLLWQSDGRDLIENNRELIRIFKNASKSRGAKRANDALLLIATTIVSLEVLARDFAGWGKRFPAAKREAEAMLGDFPLRQRTWLMDMYLYPPLGAHRELVSTLAPSAPAESALVKS